MRKLVMNVLLALAGICMVASACAATFSDGATISGRYTETLVIEAGATVTLSGVSVEVASGPGIKCEGSATLILQDSRANSITSNNGPGIQAGPSGTKLTICTDDQTKGNGVLTAYASQGAGIGSANNGKCGYIVIKGGTITAKERTGYYDNYISGAGIGSGAYGTCDGVTVSGVTVTATGCGYYDSYYKKEAPE